MKTLVFISLVLILVTPATPVYAAGYDAPGKVTLTAGMVHSAIDIEAAMTQATEAGTRPGVVILDGRFGPFEYDPQAEDVDINIFYSNLTLQGRNGASLHGGGINLDGMPLQNITLQSLEMHCPNDCITSPDGAHRNVTVRENRLQAGKTGIDVGWTDGWMILNNTVSAGATAVHLVSTAEISVINNHLQGYIPIKLEQSDGCQVTHNTMYANWWGILLAGSSQANLVTANDIAGVQAAGITLESGTSDNEVHGNQTLCAVWTDCLAVEDAGEGNHTTGNR